eukprot:1004962-Pleurochrysis_carterae.AAC.6
MVLKRWPMRTGNNVCCYSSWCAKTKEKQLSSTSFRQASACSDGLAAFRRLAFLFIEASMSV